MNTIQVIRNALLQALETPQHHTITPFSSYTIILRHRSHSYRPHLIIQLRYDDIITRAMADHRITSTTQHHYEDPDLLQQLQTRITQTAQTNQ